MYIGNISKQGLLMKLLYRICCSWESSTITFLAEPSFKLNPTVLAGLCNSHWSNNEMERERRPVPLCVQLLPLTLNLVTHVECTWLTFKPLHKHVIFCKRFQFCWLHCRFLTPVHAYNAQQTGHAVYWVASVPASHEDTIRVWPV